MTSKRKVRARDHRWDMYYRHVDRSVAPMCTCRAGSLSGFTFSECVCDWSGYGFSKVTPGFFGRSRLMKRWRWD